MTQRWPRRPPIGQPCDAHTGVSSDWSGKPVVHRCRAAAVETCKATYGVVQEVWLCEEHAAALEANGNVVRNPKGEANR